MTTSRLRLSTALSLLTLTTPPPLAQTTAPAAAVRPAHRGEMAHRSPDEKAAAMTKRMTRELTLTTDQQTKVAALNTQLAADLGQLRAAGKAERAERAERREKVQTIRTSHDANLKAVLTADQYARYEKERNEREEKMKAHAAARRAAKGKGGTVPPGPGPGPAQQ